ncbi:MAG: UDP-N-acetylglucosamine 2-epimerase [Bryobacteraceae bacterium]|jgi:UDP-N-acetylglucosamine 2-epimerase (non-hydrolysing)/GDP/UDP-N,N'-diacetylbacillosamine 2-epimerase (hydrolysing)
MTGKKRKIAVFTGNRAEYGLQYPILRAIAADPRLEYFLLAGGAHLQQDFGGTVAEIAADGFQVHAQVVIDVHEDALSGTARAIGAGILSLSGILDGLRPDFLVVYADRFESFAAVIAGTQMNIPTAHVEGGDYTEGGALDDTVRHAMTKLAHLHFTTNECAAERVRRMGEEPWRVFNVGFPALDLVAAGLYATPDEVVATLGLDLSRPIVLFCQHSVTTEFERAGEQVSASLEALTALARRGYQVVMTYPNNDAGGRRIIDELHRVERAAGPNIQVFKSLGRRNFHGLLNVIGRVGRGAFAGNSSAGIKETPAFGCPAVNIGARQQGRLRGANVLDVPYEAEAIAAAIERCASDDGFRGQCRTCRNPYGAGNAGPRIAEVLATIPLDLRLLRKKMTY